MAEEGGVRLSKVDQWIVDHYHPGSEIFPGGEALFPCRRCGASVMSGHLSKHDNWHTQLTAQRNRVADLAERPFPSGSMGF